MSKPRKKASSAMRILRVLVILLALGCAAVGAALVLNQQKEAEVTEATVFAEGVSVAGVPLTGMTVEQARTALASVEQGMAAQVQFVLDSEGTSTTLTHADMTITFDTDSVLAQAIALGNIGTKKEREEAQERLLSSPQNLPISYTVDASPAQTKIAELAARIKTEPVDAAVQMDLTVDGFFRFTEGVPGQALDEAALLATLQQRAAANDFGTVELPIRYTQPAITVETLQETLVKRSHAETSFKKSPYNRADRVYNVKKAAGLVNGFVLKPGETFSMNDTLGPRTYELGWKPAPAIVSGATEDQAGGGVCQVSSTLYAAVVKADLEIVYRRNHSSPVSYLERGLDATINTGTIDFQFKNNTAADIYIFAYTIDSGDEKVPEGQDDKTVHVEIYGEALPEEYDEIRLTSERLETLKPSGEMEYIVDTTVAWDYYKEEVARKDGSVWQSYKHYYKDGVEVREPEPLAKSTYKAYNGKITVGQGYLYQQSIPTITP